MALKLGDWRDTTTYLLIPYSLCFLLVLILAGFYTLANPDHCTHEDEAEWGCFGFGKAFYLLLTTFHAASWGHLLPETQGHRVIVCLVSAAGYLWPLATVIALLAGMGQRALVRLATVTFLVAYLGLAVLGNLVFAGILSATGGLQTGQAIDFGDCFYFVWMTFHLRAYGELSPGTNAGHAVSLLVVMAGSLCWVIPLLVVARRSVLDPGTSLFSAGPDGGYQAMLSKVVRSIMLPYSACLVTIAALAAVYAAVRAHGAQCNESSCDYGDDLVLLLTTFHGATWGHLTPKGGGQKVIACIVASLGYLWRQIALVLLLREIQQPSLAKRYAAALAVCYASMAILGSVVLAAVNVACAGTASPEDRDLGFEPIDFGTSLYYVWMTYNGRAYGDLTPSGSAGQEIVGLLATLIGNLGWIWPLLLVMRASLLYTALASVRTGPVPEVLGVVEGPAA